MGLLLTGGELFRRPLPEILLVFLTCTILGVFGLVLYYKVEWFRDKVDRYTKAIEEYFHFPISPRKLWGLQIPKRNKIIISLSIVLIPTAGLVMALTVVALPLLFYANFISFKWPPTLETTLSLILIISLGFLILYTSFKLQYKVIDKLLKKYTGKSIKQL